MALSASTVWEFASGGSMNNGGGYVTTGGSTDYSLAAPTPVYSPTTAYHAAGSTTVTVDGGAFTAAMVGNLLKCVSGTNATVGWYEIKTWIDANNITLDRTLNATANTTKDITLNIGGALAYGIAAQDTAFHAAVVAGNTIWYNGGNTSPGTTFTIAGNIAVGTAGTSLLPIIYAGYKQTRGDSCVGAYRPIVAAAAYTFVVAAYTHWKNLILTGSLAGTLFSGIRHKVTNCKATNSGAGVAFSSTTPGEAHFVGCEAVADGTGISSFGYGVILDCYTHDCNIGILASIADIVAGCVVDTCCGSSGRGISTAGQCTLLNNTIRNCQAGIYGSTTAYCTFINNIVADCFVGASWGTAEPINFWAYNCFYGNTTPRTNVTAGATDIATDPVLTGAIGKGTDGASVATTKVFTSVSAPFADVTSSDYLAIFAGTGTGIKLAVYAIVSKDSTSQLTLATDPTNAVNNISSCTFGVVKGSDFTLGSGSSCLDAALDAATYGGVTV